MGEGGEGSVSFEEVRVEGAASYKDQVLVNSVSGSPLFYTQLRVSSSFCTDFILIPRLK